ncbi:MAG: N-acetyltransferase [Chloroflexi bacterium]|nr:N-acetyltransferase [Chloroflexota bacterium]
MTIRRAKLTDLNAISDIYNDAILTSNATFDTEPKTDAEQKTWFANHGSRNPILVAEQDKAVVGWASLSQWSDRCAYDDTAEISLYVRRGFRRQGIGRKLLESVVREGEKAGLHTVIARITEGNRVSIHLHQSVGFENIGVMKEVGRKFDKLLDVYMLQKIYPSVK